jgi:hypothetical protein
MSARIPGPFTTDARLAKDAAETVVIPRRARHRCPRHLNVLTDSCVTTITLSVIGDVGPTLRLLLKTARSLGLIGII